MFEGIHICTDRYMRFFFVAFALISSPQVVCGMRMRMRWKMEKHINILWCFHRCEWIGPSTDRCECEWHRVNRVLWRSFTYREQNRHPQLAFEFAYRMPRPTCHVLGILPLKLAFGVNKVQGSSLRMASMINFHKNPTIQYGQRHYLDVCWKCSMSWSNRVREFMSLSNEPVVCLLKDESSTPVYVSLSV